MTVVDKLADGKGIRVDRARGETLPRSQFPYWTRIRYFSYLVGHVKVDEEIFVFTNLREFLPLLGRGIYTSRVVGAGVEENTGTIGHFVFQVVKTSL